MIGMLTQLDHPALESEHGKSWNINGPLDTDLLQACEYWPAFLSETSKKNFLTTSISKYISQNPCVFVFHIFLYPIPKKCVCISQPEQHLCCTETGR
jgi:hypothetical protein